MSVKAVEQSSMEKPNELSFELLAGWWTNTIQALVDTAGSEKTKSLMRPYIRNGQIAAALNVIDGFHLKERDEFNFTFAITACHYFYVREIITDADIKERGVIARVDRCPFKDGPKEICEIVCGEIYKNFNEVFHIPKKFAFMSYLARGDAECVWINYPDSWDRPKMEALGETIAKPLLTHIPKQLVDDISVQYLGEMWVMATRALGDHLGEERTTDVLEKYMRAAGMTFGSRLKESNKGRASGHELIVDGITSVHNALRMIESVGPSDLNYYEGMVKDCPFKDAPTSICSQLSAFCSGMCEAIDPHYEFAYQGMMTKGDTNCQWTIRKKGAVVVKDEAISQDPVNVLKLRFAKGEITEEEYVRKMALIRELGH